MIKGFLRALAVAAGLVAAGAAQAQFNSGSNYNTANMSYQANSTISQNIVFDSNMQAGGTFDFSVNAHAGGGRNNQHDTGNLKLEFYNSSGVLITSAQTSNSQNLIQANHWSSAPGDNPAPWSTISLSYTLSAADAANTAYVKVTMIGTDASWWAGNYGPQWQMPTLTFNGSSTNILYNPEFGVAPGNVQAQGWTSSTGYSGVCGTVSGSATCVTNATGVTANMSGGGYSATGGTTSGTAGGYSSTLTSTTILATVNNGGVPPAGGGGGGGGSSPNYTEVLNSDVATYTPTSNNSPASEGASKAMDGSSGTKYLNFDRANAGFTIKLTTAQVVQGIKFTTANDFEPRDPTTFTLYGSNDGINWTEITVAQSTTLSTISGRYTQTAFISISNTNPYFYYFITFPNIKAIDTYGSYAGCVAALGNLACDSVQIAEVTYYYDTNFSFTAPTLGGTGTVANPGTPGSVSSMPLPGPQPVNNGSGSTSSNPSGTTVTTVTNGGTYTNNGTAAAVTNTGTMTNGGTTGDVTNSGTFTNNGTTGDVTNSGTFNNNGTTGDVTNQAAGTFNNNSGGVTGDVTNAGTFNNSGTTGDVTNSSGGTFNNYMAGITGNVTNGGTFNNSGTTGTVSNSGTFTNNAGGTTGAITNTGTLSNAGTVASLTNSGTASNNGTISGSVTNSSGTFTNSGTTGDWTNDATIANTGTMGDGTNNGTFTNDGTVGDVNNTGTFANNATGTGGDFTNSGTLNNLGTIAGLTNSGTTTNGGTVSGSTVNTGTLSNSGTMAYVNNNSSGSFTNSGTTGDVANDGTLDNNGGNMGAVGNSGSFTNWASSTIASLINSGAASNNGTITGTVDNSNLFTNAGTAGDVANSGTFTNMGNGTIHDLVNDAGATATNDGTIAGAITNNGTLTNTGTAGNWVNNNIMTNSGTMGDGTNTGTMTNSGDLGDVDNSGLFTFVDGSIDSMTNMGTLDASNLNVPSRLGAFTQTNTGTLIIDGNTVYGIDGDANLDGNVTIQNAPTAFGRYTYLTAGSVNGQFAGFTANPSSNSYLKYTGTEVKYYVTPDSAATQISIRSVSNDVADVNNKVMGNIAGVLGNDCSAPGLMGGCMSIGYGTSLGNGDLQSGSVTVSRAITPQVRLGVTMGQNFTQPKTGIAAYKQDFPITGAFIGITNPADFGSFDVMASAAAQSGEYTINRPEVSGAESGMGIAKTNGSAFQVKATYSMPLDDTTTISPYVGLRHSIMDVNGYTETGSVFPLTVNPFSTNSTDVIAGVGVTKKLTDKLTASVGVGVTQNIANDSGKLKGSSEIGGLSSYEQQMNGGGKGTSASVGAGLSYEVAPGQRVTASVGWQDKTMFKPESTTVGLTWSFSF